MFEVRTYIISGKYAGNYDDIIRFSSIEYARSFRKKVIANINRMGVYRASLYPTIFEYKKGDISGEYGYYYIEG